MTFSSTSRLIPLFNLFSAALRESSPTTSYLRSPSTRAPRCSPLRSVVPPHHLVQMSARTHPHHAACSSVSLSFSLFLLSFPLPVSTFRPLVPLSLFVVRSCSFLPLSLSLSLSRLRSGARARARARETLSFPCRPLRSPISPSFFILVGSPSPLFAPLRRLSSDSSWRLSSLDCGAMARLCAIQGGLQGRGIKQTS